MKLLSIGAASRKFGVSIATLRRWEAEGKIAAERTKAGHRRYSVTTLKKLFSTRPVATTVESAPEFDVPYFPFPEHSAARNFVQETINSPILLEQKYILAGMLLVLACAGTTVVGIKSRILDRVVPQSVSSVVNDKISQVLAAESTNPQYVVKFNVPVEFENDASVSGNLTVKGNLLANNLINSIIPGKGIVVTGTQQVTITNNDLGSAQNIFKNFTIGSTTITAGSNTDTFTIASGDNITLSADSTNKKLTISADQADPTTAGWTDDGSLVRLTTAADLVSLGTTTGTAKLNVTSLSSEDIFSGYSSSTLVANLNASGLLSLPATGYAAGIKLQNASTLFSGTGAPNNSGGSNGDYYLRSDAPSNSTSLYVKISGVWTAAGGGGASDLQAAYDGGSSITTSNNNNLSINLANTAVDSNFLVNIASGSTSSLQIQNAGTTVTTLDTSGITTANVLPSADLTYNLGSSSARWNTIYANNIIAGSTGVSGYWQRVAGAMAPTNITDDVLLGANATSSAKIVLSGTTGNLTTTGSTILGDAIASDTLTLNARVASLIEPSTGSTYDLGSSARRWATVYGDTGNFTNFSSSTTTISGTTASDFTVNTDNATNDTEDSSFTFERGTPVTNVQLKWNSITKNLFVNSPTFSVLGDTGIAYSGQAALIVNQVQDQDLFTASASGIPKFVLDHSGNVGIGTTSPLAALDVRGNSATTAVASASGTTNFAALVANNNGSGDLFTASASSQTRFVITNAGNVGIGTAVPASKLDIGGGQLTFSSSVASFLGYGIGRDSANDLAFNGGTAGYQFNNNANTTNLVKITNTGSVGIGTTNPGKLLELFTNSSNGTAVEELLLNGSTQNVTVSGSGQTIGFVGAGPTYYGAFGGYGNGTVGGMAIWSGTDTGTPQIFVNTNGGLGIGTVTPQGLLHVDGKVTGKALAIFNQTTGGDQNLLAASQAGVSKFVVDNSGNVLLAASDRVDTLTAGTLNLGTTTANNVTIGNTTAGTIINLNSGASTQNAFSFNANSLTTGTGAYLNSSTLSSGTLFSSYSTSTALTSGKLGYFNWEPSSPATSSGDLVGINIGNQGFTTGNLFNITNAGSSLFSVSQTQITSAIPQSFTATGDVGIAYDLAFTNPTASYIKSNASLYLQAGPVYASNNLSLQTYNSGKIVLDSPGGVTLNQSQAWTFGSGTLQFDTTNSRIGIGSTTPLTTLFVTDSQTATASAMIVNSNTAAGIKGLAIQLKSTTLDTTSRFINFLDKNGTIIGKVNAANTTTVAYSANGTDLAEYFVKDTGQTFTPGDVVSTSDSYAVKSFIPYDPKLIGIVSTAPSFVGGVEGTEKVLVAISGQVPVKVDPNSAPIARGDFLTSSTMPGLATRAKQAGFMIGKAVENWQPGQDTVLVYVANIWADPYGAQASGVSLTSFNTTLGLVDDQFASLSAQISDLNLELSDLSAAASMSASLWSYATDSGKLITTLPVQTGELSVIGPLHVGLLSFDDLDASLSSLTGTVTVNSNLAVAGKIKVLGSSIGTGILPKGKTEIIVQSTAVSANSAIFVTPNIAVPIPLSVTDSTPSSSFKVEIPSALPKDVPFKWWIVN